MTESRAYGDNPYPSCPVLRVTGASLNTPPAKPASVCSWNDAYAFVETFFPGACSGTISMYVQSWFNILPPLCEVGDLCVTEQPPACPPPSIATSCEWENALSYIDLFFPGACQNTVDIYALQWFNLLPPCTPCFGGSCPVKCLSSTCQDSVLCTANATVATQVEWAEAMSYIELFFPGANTSTNEYYALIWFNLLPPN